MPPKRRVFISGRILGEMREYKQAAENAIKDADMDPVYFDTAEAGKSGSIRRSVDLLHQLLEGVKTSDAFVGLYGRTLTSNWKPPGQQKQSIILEYEAAQEARLPRFCYVAPSDEGLDPDMLAFRKRVMAEGVGFLGTREELYNDLLAQLKMLDEKIFISWSSKDESFVTPLHKQLADSGHRAWLNTESLPKGERWRAELFKALEEASLMILVLSPDAIQSKWVAEEWRAFLKLGKPIIPLLYRDCKIPRSLDALQMIKSGNDDKWYYQMLKAVEGRL
jgi:hypothetical protein